MVDPSFRLRAAAWEVLKSLLSLLSAVKDWMEARWPDVVESPSSNEEATSSHGVSRPASCKPMVDTTFASTSGESKMSHSYTQRKSYTYYKTAGRSSCGSALTHEGRPGDEVYFAVCRGIRPDVYLTYADCVKAMEGHPNPLFMKFSSRVDAEWFVQNGHGFVPRHFRRF